MNALYDKYLPLIVILFLVFGLLTVLLERRFFKTIKLYWFYNRSFFSYLSSLTFLLGVGALLLSLMDFRGPEEKIKTGVAVQRTIILIDTSASMLAEDIRPSRLQKAILIAKHFARKAAGHQLSVVAFAEIQKKIVPFTQDLDLIDARLESIKNLRNHNGGSALSQAIQESLQYFRETGEVRGNILILTDGEETAEGIGLKVPKEINVALVGIGTSQGGRIPLDDGRGLRYGYKKHRAQDVITKLNEDFFKKIVVDISQARYWLANSYSLPSDEVMDFFQGDSAKADKEQDMVIRPVMMEWIVVPALIFLIFSYLFKAVRVFTLSIFLVVLPLRAQEAEAPDLSPEIVSKIQQLQKGELTQLEKVKLADDLHKAGALNEAVALYEENLPVDKIHQDMPPEAYVNYGTALLEKGDPSRALSLYDQVQSKLQNDSKSLALKELMEKNTVNFFKQQEKQKQDQKNKDEKQSKQDQKEKQEKNNSNGKGDDQKKDSQENNQQENKDEKKNQEQDQQDNQQDQKKPENGEKPEQKPLPTPKIPAKLKQLMSDDRQLQLKIIEQNTRDMNRRNRQQDKDW
jgi:Ca-activated chloride channel homolog